MENPLEKYVDRLLETSYQKHKLLREILELTQSQSQTINENGLEELGELISEKQARIDEINRLDETFNIYFKRLKQELKIESLEQVKNPNVRGIKELQEIIKQITGLISEISGIEKQNNEKAKSLLDYLGNEIKKISQGRKAASAYMPGPRQPSAYFIDKKK